MTNGNDVPPAGALLDALATVRGLSVEGLLDQINRALSSRGEKEVSRITWWKWRTGKCAPCREHALLMEDVLGISPRAWGPQAQPSAREA